jgi:NAD(P)-dependent dehydrogenase (short-subunit alcohol dehydrogenase family)
MRVLVTGGAGFIGSHVVDRLLRPGIEPRIFDVRPSPHHGAGEVDSVLGDLLDREALSTAMRGCDAVVHLAAAADVDDVALRPAAAEAVNRARHAQRPRGRAPRGRGARRLREHDLGLRQRDRHRRRGPHGRAARPPLHRHEARGRDVLPLRTPRSTAWTAPSCASGSPTARARDPRA